MWLLPARQQRKTKEKASHRSAISRLMRYMPRLYAPSPPGPSPRFYIHTSFLIGIVQYAKLFRFLSKSIYVGLKYYHSKIFNDDMILYDARHDMKMPSRKWPQYATGAPHSLPIICAELIADVLARIPLYLMSTSRLAIYAQRLRRSHAADFGHIARRRRMRVASARRERLSKCDTGLRVRCRTSHQAPT